MIKTALIFAAGRGERLLPLTANTPKPMLKIQNKPILAYHLENLSQQGYQHVIINHAYLGDQIKAYCGQGQAFNLCIDYFAEPPGGLETGGTLAMIARHFKLESSFLLTINADIFTDYSFALESKIKPNKVAHLILVPMQKNLGLQGDFGLDDHQNLLLEPKHFIFSGIAYYRLSALLELPLGRYSIRNWLFAQTRAQGLSAEIYPGLWIDIGSQERLQLARDLINSR